MYVPTHNKCVVTTHALSQPLCASSPYPNKYQISGAATDEIRSLLCLLSAFVYVLVTKLCCHVRGHSTSQPAHTRSAQAASGEAVAGHQHTVHPG